MLHWTFMSDTKVQHDPWNIHKVVFGFVLARINVCGWFHWFMDTNCFIDIKVFSNKHECQTITRPHHKASSKMTSLKSQHTLTHWGRVTHICVSKLTIIGSDNGLAPGWHQTIIWTNYGILLIGPLGTNFSETLIGIQTFSFKKMHLKMLSVKWHPFCLGLNVLTYNSTPVSNVSSSC